MDIDAIIAQAAGRYGLDPSVMRQIAQIESSMNPRAQNPNSSAGGLYQFIDSTARQYGLSDRFDPSQAADAAARLARDNAAALRNALGREPTGGELYLAHQQGAGGAIRLLRNPSADASSLVGADAVRLNGGRAGMTAGDFAGIWTRRINNSGQGNNPAQSAGAAFSSYAAQAPQSAPPAAGNALAAMVQPPAQPSPPEWRGNALRVADFMRQPNALAPMGFAPGLSPFIRG